MAEVCALFLQCGDHWYVEVMALRDVTPCTDVSEELGAITYLLHAAALLQKLTGSQLVKKFPAFYGTRKFITAFPRARRSMS